MFSESFAKQKTCFRIVYIFGIFLAEIRFNFGKQGWNAGPINTEGGLSLQKTIHGFNHAGEKSQHSRIILYHRIYCRQIKTSFLPVT